MAAARGAKPGVSYTDSPIAIQLAALPWYVIDGKVEVLLVTSSTNSRWMLRKGWPMEGLTAAEAAAQEALEEVGVRGELAANPLGSYRYIKLLDDDVSTRASQRLFTASR